MVGLFETPLPLLAPLEQLLLVSWVVFLWVSSQIQTNKQQKQKTSLLEFICEAPAPKCTFGEQSCKGRADSPNCAWIVGGLPVSVVIEDAPAKGWI